MSRLELQAEAKLIRLARALVDQHRARVIVAPHRAAAGFWFGGGNLTRGPDGELYLVGRYRNQGDSRSGLGAGERGLELAVFRSSDGGQTFEKVLRFGKADLRVGAQQVLSIEGSALHWTGDGVELFVSTEKTGIGYPSQLAPFLKPGTGVWTIDRLRAASLDQLAGASIETVVQSRDPRFLHVKDPVVYDAAGGDTLLMFCTHPYSWSSSNTAYTTRRAGNRDFAEPCFDFFPRGFTWDVAITRGTAIVDLPRHDCFGPRQVSLLFYDGGEALRNLDEHASAVKRPRGYSCEELGGAAYFLDGDMGRLYRLAPHLPLLVSPWGTGCSRYVDVLAGDDQWLATWQQSRDDLSQPLVMNRLSGRQVASLLESG